MPFSPPSLPSLPSPPAIFPLYLLPSLPFRRRSSAATSPSTPPSLSSSPTSTNSTRGSPPAPSYLTGSTSHLRCARCLTDLCPTSAIISKGFTGRHGRAYLVAPPTAISLRSKAGDLPNTHTHKACPRQLVTGAHTVSDISCAMCGTVLGWKYVAAEQEAQKYKVGNFILETKRIVKGADWEREGEEEEEGRVESRGAGKGEGVEEEELQFDSQDEDECQDLFEGIWSPQLARKRRKNRRFDEGGV